MIFSLVINVLPFINIFKELNKQLGHHQMFLCVINDRPVIAAYLKHLPEDSDDYQDTEGT